MLKINSDLSTSLSDRFNGKCDKSPANSKAIFFPIPVDANKACKNALSLKFHHIQLFSNYFDLASDQYMLNMIWNQINIHE